MNKTVLIIIIFAFMIALGIIFLGNSQSQEILKEGQNVEIRNGIQYITINARGGYFPRVSSAQADIPTKLILKTNGTFDCSSALMIRSIGFQEILPQTGEVEIDLGIPKTNIPLEGICSMGMYSFKINFI